MLCSYSNRTSEAPHTNAANHGNTFIDGMFFFTANFTRASKTHDSMYKDQLVTWSSVLTTVMCNITV